MTPSDLKLFLFVWLWVPTTTSPRNFYRLFHTGVALLHAISLQKNRNVQAFKVGKVKCQATYGHSLDFKSSHELIGFKEQRTCTCRQQQSYLKKNKLVSHSAGHILHCNKLSTPKVRVYINWLLLLVYRLGCLHGKYISMVSFMYTWMIDITHYYS